MKPNPRALNRAVEDVKDRLSNSGRGNWDGAGPSVLIGLYAINHEVVYGVFPEEVADDWYPAMSKVKSFLKKKFNDDVSKAVEFIRWTWQRERRSLQNHESKNPGEPRDFRISWRYQFSTGLLTGYRMMQSERRARDAQPPRQEE